MTYKLIKELIMENKFTTNGSPSWIELMAEDIPLAIKFYSEVFNWKFDKCPTENKMTYYTICLKDEEIPFGGVFDKKDALTDVSNVPSHWGNYFTVVNIEASILKIKELNGNIIVPITYIPEVGKFAVIQDPQGAVISLMEYSSEAANC